MLVSIDARLLKTFEAGSETWEAWKIRDGWKFNIVISKVCTCGGIIDETVVGGDRPLFARCNSKITDSLGRVRGNCGKRCDIPNEVSEFARKKWFAIHGSKPHPTW